MNVDSLGLSGFLAYGLPGLWMDLFCGAYRFSQMIRADGGFCSALTKGT